MYLCVCVLVATLQEILCVPVAQVVHVLLCVYVYVCLCVYVYDCLCVYVHIYTHLCVCVCVCVSTLHDYAPVCGFFVFLVLFFSGIVLSCRGCCPLVVACLTLFSCFLCAFAAVCR